MSEGHLATVVNVHHYGGIDKLPSNVKYIGRPSQWGNRYSSKSGQYTKEQCVALHRIGLYESLVTDPSLLMTLQRDLGGHDLACWCKHPKKLFACHGDNYLHVLHERNITRPYTKSVIFYLRDDLRSAIGSLQERVTHKVAVEDYLPMLVALGDAKISVNQGASFCREKKVAYDAESYLLAQMVVDLELARDEDDLKMVEYHFNHLHYVVNVFVSGRDDLYQEPARPDAPLKKKGTKK